jgi:hypothetical protein
LDFLCWAFGVGMIVGAYIVRIVGAEMKLKRPYVPLHVRLDVIARQLQYEGRLMDVLTVVALTMKNTDRLAYLLKAMFGDEKVHLDHDPSLVLRHYDEETGKYTPDANDPMHLVYRTAEQHREKTFLRNGADFSDAAKRRRKIKQERKEKEPPRPSRWPAGQKLRSRPFLKVVR